MRFLPYAVLLYVSLPGGPLVRCLPAGGGSHGEPGRDSLDLTETTAVQLTESLDKNNLATLRYISVITRHGHRSPTATYPNDPYPFTDLRYWPDGPGQLTLLGKQQLFRTGRIIRRRYDGFLNAQYFPNDTSVRSNPYDRDFMSAACLLAGLYPPVAYQIWHRKIIWQPIPIWEDRFDVAEITTRPDICPRFAEEMYKALSELDKILPQYKGLLEYLSKHMGEKIGRVTRIPQIWDTFELQQENGYKLPAWATKVFPYKMEEIEGRAFRAFVGETKEQIRLSSGPVLEMVLEQLNEKARGTMRPDRKLHILAAHDITLRAVLSGLGINDPFPIATSAFMLFELHENAQGHNVKVAYFNSSSTPKPRYLEMPSCRTPCSLTTFNKVLEPIIPKNWNEECHNVTTTPGILADRKFVDSSSGPSKSTGFTVKSSSGPSNSSGVTANSSSGPSHSTGVTTNPSSGPSNSTVVAAKKEKMGGKTS